MVRWENFWTDPDLALLTGCTGARCEGDAAHPWDRMSGVPTARKDEKLGRCKELKNDWDFRSSGCSLAGYVSRAAVSLNPCDMSQA